MTDKHWLTRTITLTLLAVSTVWTGCAHHGPVRRHKVAPEECYATPMHYGFHGTCWRPWPKDWVACREQEVESKWQPTLPVDGKGKPEKSAIKAPAPPKLDKVSPSDVPKLKAQAKSPKTNAVPKVNVPKKPAAPKPAAKKQSSRLNRSKTHRVVKKKRSTRKPLLPKIVIAPPPIFSTNKKANKKPASKPKEATIAQASSPVVLKVQKPAPILNVVSSKVSGSTKLQPVRKRRSRVRKNVVKQNVASQFGQQPQKSSSNKQPTIMVAPSAKSFLLRKPAPIVHQIPTPAKRSVSAKQAKVAKSFAPIRLEISPPAKHQLANNLRRTPIDAAPVPPKPRKPAPIINRVKVTQSNSAPKLRIRAVARSGNDSNQRKSQATNVRLTSKVKTAEPTNAPALFDEGEAPLATVTAPNFKKSQKQRQVVRVVANPKPSASRKDDQLRQRIESQISKPSIRYSVKSGTVTVRGVVSSFAEKRQLLARVRAIKGVQLILDGLKVK